MENEMTSLVTRETPDFTAQAVMPDNTFAELKLSSYRGKYVVLFFYPLDFTFVCPSEIIAFDKALVNFKEKGAEVIGVSVDSHFTHLAWKNTPVEKGGIGNVQYPLVADITKEISRSYGVLFNESVALRGLFIIDKEGVVRHGLVNDLPLGRSVGEAERVLDALQFTEKHGEVCPANWKEGEDAMKPTADGVADYLSKHAK
jgi:peroxiredoxin 2/4